MDFLETKYLYLGLILFSLSYPLAQSFEFRIRFYKKWSAIFIATTVMMMLFIPWDIWFTGIGVWWFREDYITGYKIFLLPVEEWLFFIVVPYACIFIYEVLRFFVKKDLFYFFSRFFFAFLSIFLMFFAVLYYPNYYTSITFSLTSIACAILVFYNPFWIGRFLMMYLVSLIPFLIINGALTGSFTEAPVVNYNPDEIIGFRILTIPVEDSVYNLLMLLVVVSVYEKLKPKPFLFTN